MKSPEERGTDLGEALIQEAEQDKAMPLDEFYAVLQAARDSIDERIVIGRELGECD